MGKPEGCLCNLRSVHIDGHDKLKGDEIASHGPHLVCGCSFWVADVILDTSSLMPLCHHGKWWHLKVRYGGWNLDSNDKKKQFGDLLMQS